MFHCVIIEYMKIIVLVNDESNKIKSEHGMSVLVETLSKRFLVDFGSSDLFLQNAQILGVDLAIDFAVVSHNHNDHNGGVESFLIKYPETKLFIGNETRMTFGGKHFPHYKLGIEKNFFKRYASNITYIGDKMNIENVYLLNIPYNKSERRGANQYIMKGGLLFKDVYQHEITVCVLENDTLNIISPCSHKGANNIIEECKKHFPKAKQFNFFGGIHTKGRSDKPLNCSVNEVEHIADEFKKQNLNKIYLGHCTGQTAIDIIKNKGLSVETILGGERYEF